MHSGQHHPPVCSPAASGREGWASTRPQPARECVPGNAGRSCHSGSRRSSRATRRGRVALSRRADHLGSDRGQKLHIMVPSRQGRKAQRPDGVEEALRCFDDPALRPTVVRLCGELRHALGYTAGTGCPHADSVGAVSGMSREMWVYLRVAIALAGACAAAWTFAPVPPLVAPIWGALRMVATIAAGGGIVLCLVLAIVGQRAKDMP